MKIVLVLWTLLLFGASLSSGHYIRQSEDNSNVYSVKDGASGITFVNPKPKGPTLREILYYHVIEREPRESPEHPITERSFTNSHGYQFLEHFPSTDEQEQYEEGPDEYLHNEHDDENENDEHEVLDENKHEETSDELHEVEEETENQDQEEPESSTTLKPLTDADVKDAYKARSYLFDQMRQRYAVKRMADSLHRRKRQAETEELKPLPEAPKLMSDIGDTAHIQPNTYGMNIQPEGGYVWNNLNKPNSYYELGTSSGNSNEGQDESPQSQEHISASDNANEEEPNSENLETINENPNDSNEDVLSDICVDINKPCALRLQRSQVPNAEYSEDNNENSEINDSGANSDESSVGDNESNDDSESDDGVPNYPIGSVAFENPELSSAEHNYNSGDESNKPDAPKTYGMSLTSGGGHVWNDLVNPPVSYEVGSSNENPEPSNSEANYPVEPIIAGNESDDDLESDDGASAPTELEISENDAVAENPEAIEGILATMQPPEDIPKTYGMNLTSDGGHVWNTLVNPPVSYDIGSSNNNPEPINPIPEPNTSEANNSGEPIVSEEAASNSESNEGADPQIPGISEIPEPSYNDAVENRPMTIVDPAVSYDIGSSNQQPEPNNSEAIPEPVIEDDASNDNSEPNEGAYPKEPELYENPTIYTPPVSEIGSIEHSASNEQASSNENSEHKDSEQSNENYGSGNGGSQSEEKPASSLEVPEESSEGDRPKEPFWNIPEAPTLPPLNYDNLPDYIRNVISSTEKSGYSQPTDSPTPAYNYPQTSEGQTMEEKVEDSFTTDKPADVPNTYGMSLNGDGGHVWNDMVNPPISYDVGSPSKSEEDHKEEPTSESNEKPESHESEEDQEQPAYPAEPEIQEESKEPDNYEHKPEPIPETEFENPELNPEPEDEGIHEEEQPEDVEEPSEENQDNLEEQVNEPAEVKPEEETAKPETEPFEEPAEPEPVSETEEFENPELNPEGIHEEEQPEDVEEPSEENQDNLEEQVSEPAEVKPEEGNAKPDIMNELLKSELFWRWLGLWTETYMELLEKHIRKIALEEICNHQRTGNQMCPLNNYSEDAGVIMKDEKIVVDGKEMDLTHRDNLDTELKGGHHSQNSHNKGEGNKIEASTIYGNSVGNEKVTNVFIFTADKADEVIDKLKPANDSEIDFIIDERAKEEESKDKNEAQANKDDSDVDEVSEEGSNESEANNENKEETNKEEVILSESDEEELNKGEDSKQDSNQEEFEKVENNKEESNEKEELEKEQSKENEPFEEGDKEEASEDASKEGEVEELNKMESSEGQANEEEAKEESNKGEGYEEELNREEENKEALSEVEANKELDKEEDIKEESTDEESKEGSTEAEVNEKDLNTKEESSEGEANELKLNEEEAKESEASEGSNESKEISEPEGKDELNKDGENKDKY